MNMYIIENLALKSFYFQEPLCTTNSDLECVRNQAGFQTQISACNKRCNGLIVSSYTETNRDRDKFLGEFKDLLQNYSQYRGGDLSPESKLIMFFKFFF